MMLQQEEPRDYVIATGVQYSVREFIEKAAAKLGITIRWQGEGKDEVGVIESLDTKYSKLKVGEVIVQIDPRYFRPAEVEALLGDPTKAREELGWIPLITLDEMIDEMVAHDLEKAKRYALLKENGYEMALTREN